MLNTTYDTLYIMLNTNSLYNVPYMTMGLLINLQYKHIDTVLLNQLLTYQLYGHTNLIVLLLFGNCLLSKRVYAEFSIKQVRMTIKFDTIEVEGSTVYTC